MKAEPITEGVFTVQVGDHKTKRMRVVSRWNGLMELRTEKGEVLIVSEPDPGFNFDAFFNNAFRTADKVKSAGTEIVMGSPDLIASLRQAAAETERPAPLAPPPPEAPPPRRP